MTKPTILLVEDGKELLDQMATRLDRRGVRVIPRRTMRDAMGAFRRRSSEISALLTDIRLDESDPKDRSGLKLGVEIAKISPTMPRFAYSGYALPEGTHIFDEVFDKVIPGGPGANGIFDNLDRIVDRATAYDNDRYLSAPNELLALKEKYAISDSDFAMLISGWRVGDLDRLATAVWADEESGHEADRSRCVVRFVTAGTKIEGGRVRSNIAVVVKQLESTFKAELFGLPVVFSYADSETDALTELTAYLFECYVDLLTTGEGVSQDGCQNDILRFCAFLTRSFEVEA